MSVPGLATCWGLTPDGIGAALISVEAHVARGLPTMGVIGLPGASVAEARWRVRSAIANTGLPWPQGRITVALAPAELPKNGTGLDLAMAIALLAADGRIAPVPAGTACVGELALDGALRPVRGVLAMAMRAQAGGIQRLVVPAGNAGEAGVVEGIEVAGVTGLAHAIDVLAGRDVPVEANDGRPASDGPAALDGQRAADLRDVRGLGEARLALEVMAAGGHHGLLIGDAGSGKTMLAERLPGILPPLTARERLEVTAIHASQQRDGRVHGIVVERPFVAPHHSASVPAVIGGLRGQEVRPGAVTLAHHGVLFLDEAPEFSRPVLESLREPMEAGAVVIARAAGSVRLPASCQVLLAANACPCGAAGRSRSGCTCSSLARRRYLDRLSGPLLDRVDLRIAVSRPSSSDLRGSAPEATQAVRARVVEARARMLARAGVVNARVPAARLLDDLRPQPAALRLLESVDTGPRGHHRILRLAWTLADLRDLDRPGFDEVSQAMAFREGSP